MPLVRIIGRLDIKAPNVIKGVQLEGLKVVGEPAQLARRYDQLGIDELLFMDVVASLYERNTIFSIVQAVASEVLVPLTVGGGLRSLDDINLALRSGADKVAINTMAVRRPELLAQAAQMFGSQCIVLSVEAGQRGRGQWEVLTDNGREKTGKDVLQWVTQAQDLGIGEVLVTSVDKEGTRQGFDIPLLQAIAERVSVPVIGCGGAGTIAHVVEAVTQARLEAVSIASLLHYQLATVAQIKQGLQAAQCEVRV
jgi:imidazole glycerol-phosphate synthase subunit HisF